MKVGEMVVEIESQHELSACHMCFNESGEISNLVCYDHDGHIWTIDSSGVDMGNLPPGIKVTQAAAPERGGDPEMLAEIFMGIVKQRADKLDFGWALLHLKWGRRVTREGWDGIWLRPDGWDCIWLRLCDPDDNGKPSIRQNCAMHVPWTPTQEDLLATDWRIVDG